MLKEFLSEHGVVYLERDVTVDRTAATDLFRLTNQMGVPVTIIDDQTVIGFDQAKLEHLLATAIHGPSLGAAVGDAARITKMRGLPPSAGAYVGGVRPGSLAQRIGLTIGDIITEVNEQQIEGPDDLERIIASFREGSRISLSFSRGEQKLSTSGTF